MDDNYILAIDQSTTTSTAFVFDHKANVKGRAYSEFTQYYPRPGWVEHDAEEVWNVTRGVIQKVLEKSGIRGSNLNAIGIANQRETTVMWDRATGKPVAPAVVWQDRRTAPFCEALKAKGMEDMVRRKTGLVIDAYFSGTKVKWLLDNVEGLRASAAKGEIAFGTIDSWLIWHLTGGKVHSTDYSNASRTLLFNIHDQKWDEELLDLLNIPAAILPEVRPSSYVYSKADRAVFSEGHGIPISGCAGDQQAALFGQACYGEGRAKNTYGTGSFVLMNTGTEAAASKAGLLTTIAWKIGDQPVEYAMEGAIFVTGAAVQWLRDGLGIIREAAETEALAKSLSSNEGVYFVPALVGLGAPHWDPYARGTLLGLTRGSTKAHVARAVLESMCYQTRDVVEAMQRDSGIPLKELRCDGGASANGFLMQFQSDILGVPVEVPEVAETTALGAAYLAGLATGYWSSRAEIDANWRLSRRYVPSIGRAEREHDYGQWLKAVERAKDWARENPA